MIVGRREEQLRNDCSDGRLRIMKVLLIAGVHLFRDFIKRMKERR